MKVERGYVYNVNIPTGGSAEVFTAPNTSPYKPNPYGSIVKGYY